MNGSVMEVRPVTPDDVAYWEQQGDIAAAVAMRGDHIGADNIEVIRCAALCGEAGELANIVKKLRRIQTGTPGLNDPSEAELKQALEDEMADVFLYLDLLAQFYSVRLPEAIARKFNIVSVRQDFPERLEVER